jgi:restriction system protein
MSIPDFQTIMLPLLRLYEDREEHSIHECNENLKNQFQISEEEMNVMIQSGKQTVFFNRVSWARTYLVKAELLKMTRRTLYRITERGEEVLRNNPEVINIKYLKRYPEFKQFYERKGSEKTILKFTENNRTPEEILEESFQEIRDNLAQELLDNIKECSPAFFEQLVVDLLVKMG